MTLAARIDRAPFDCATARAGTAIVLPDIPEYTTLDERLVTRHVSVRAIFTSGDLRDVSSALQYAAPL